MNAHTASQPGTADARQPTLGDRTEPGKPAAAYRRLRWSCCMRSKRMAVQRGCRWTLSRWVPS